MAIKAFDECLEILSIPHEDAEKLKKGDTDNVSYDTQVWEIFRLWKFDLKVVLFYSVCCKMYVPKIRCHGFLRKFENVYCRRHDEQRSWKCKYDCDSADLFNIHSSSWKNTENAWKLTTMIRVLKHFTSWSVWLISLKEEHNVSEILK